MRKRRYCKKGVFVLLAALVLNTLTYANMIYNFHIFNNPGYENDIRLNFTLTTTDEGQNQQGKNQVGFLFENSSLIGSSITAIYFDDGSLLNMNENFLEGQGVNFSQGATPKSLPAGNTLNPPFDKKPVFSTDSDPPVFHNGINPDEWLKLVFVLKDNKSYSNVIAEIAAGGSTTEENLRIGIHIQGLPNDDSVSAINCTRPISDPAPEPATIALLTLGGLVLFRRKSA